MENVKDKDRMTEIQDRMNSVDVAKRKRILVIFACVCVVILVLKLVVTYGVLSGDGGKEEQKTEVKSGEVSKSEEEQVLEFSLERRKKSDEFEDYLDRLVEEDRKKEKEIKDGETK